MPGSTGVSIPPYMESLLKAALQRVLREVGRLIAELIREWLENQFKEGSDESSAQGAGEGGTAAGDDDAEPHSPLPSPPSLTPPGGQPAVRRAHRGAEAALPSGRGEETTEARAEEEDAIEPLLERAGGIALEPPAEPVVVGEGASAAEPAAGAPAQVLGAPAEAVGEGREGTVLVRPERNGTVVDATATFNGTRHSRAGAAAMPRPAGAPARTASGFVSPESPQAVDYPRLDPDSIVEAALERLIEEGRLIDRRELEEFHRRMQREAMTESLF
jgi:hypothetical protein